MNAPLPIKTARMSISLKRRESGELDVALFRRPAVRAPGLPTPPPTRAEEAFETILPQIGTLIEEIIHAPSPRHHEEAIGFLLTVIADACKMFDGLCQPSRDRLHPKAVEIALRTFLFGFADLQTIQRVVDIIGEPIEADHERSAAASRYKFPPEVKGGPIYSAVLVAFDFFDLVREEPGRIQSFLENGGWLKEFRSAIEQLPPHQTNPQAWAEIIQALVLRGEFGDTKAEFQPGGRIYAAVKKDAVRNRKGKLRRAFRTRFGVLPASYLLLSRDRMMEIKDRSKRGARDPLDNAKIERVQKRALKIEDMVPNPGELNDALAKAILVCVKTIPRKTSPERGMIMGK